MKKTFISPKARVIVLESCSMLAGSDEQNPKFTFNREEEISGDVGSNKRQGIWDED